MFLKWKNGNMLHEHWPYNFAIDLEWAWPQLGPIYNLIRDELIALWKYIDEKPEKWFIQHSKFIVGALILFVKKKYEDIRVVGSIKSC
jgi:hypothetical protein